MKHITAILFLVVFLLPRVADLHALDHLSDDEGISCELCEITSHSQELDLYFGKTSCENIHIANRPSARVTILTYNSPTAKIVSPTAVYNKPPPIEEGLSLYYEGV